MTETVTRADVIVVGAGVAGCGAARELAPDHDVCVLEKGQIAGETTGKASGLISIVHDYADHPAAAGHALSFFDAYDGTHSFEYTRRPSVNLVTETAVVAARAEVEQLTAAGFDVEYLDANELEERYPDAFVLDEFAGAIEYGPGGWVDPHSLTMAFAADAREGGAVFETDTAVTGLLVEDGSITGVETDAGEKRADHVVVAAGWRTRELVAPFIDLPIRPFRYQTINLEVDRSFGEEYPVAWEDLTHVYWRPEHNGDLHVGGGTYFVDDPGDVRTTTTEEFERLVATTIADRVPDLGEARIASADTCLTGDAATPDEFPILDAPPEAPEGLVLATGLHGFGIMASPVVGTAVRSIVTDERAPFSLEPFALDRFDSREPTFDSEYIAEPSEPLRTEGVDRV